MTDRAPRRVTSADGTRIAFEAAGNGPPLVIVGGAFSLRGDGRELVEILAGRFTAACYDRRGRGDSGDAQPYAPQREIEDLGAVIEALGGSAFVHGHSSGAALSLDAVAAGLPVTRLSIYEPPFTIDDTRPPYPDDFLDTLREHLERGRRDEAVAEFLGTGLLLPEPAILGMRESPDWSQMTELAHTLLYDFAILGDRIGGKPLPASMGHAITIPVLLLSGGDSPPTLQSPVAALEDLLPNATRRVVEGQGHGAPAAVLAPILEAFFAG